MTVASHRCPAMQSKFEAQRTRPTPVAPHVASQLADAPPASSSPRQQTFPAAQLEALAQVSGSPPAHSPGAVHSVAPSRTQHSAVAVSQVVLPQGTGARAASVSEFASAAVPESSKAVVEPSAEPASDADSGDVPESTGPTPRPPSTSTVAAPPSGRRTSVPASGSVVMAAPSRSVSSPASTKLVWIGPSATPASTEPTPASSMPFSEEPLFV